MQQEALDQASITEPEEIIASDNSGVIALILGAISGGAVVGLIWLFAALLF